jgi:hypothetical protein
MGKVRIILESFSKPRKIHFYQSPSIEILKLKYPGTNIFREYENLESKLPTYSFHTTFI